ncbi:MAG: hypothetical protein ACI4KI_00650 [Candidatus Fimenecus sp.]
MCSLWERDATFGSDVHFVRDVCLRQAERNTSHHFAAKPQYITVRKHHITFVKQKHHSQCLPVNAGKNELPFLKKMVELRIEEILSNDI